MELRNGRYYRIRPSFRGAGYIGDTVDVALEDWGQSVLIDSNHIRVLIASKYVRRSIDETRRIIFREQVVKFEHNHQIPPDFTSKELEA